MMDNEDIDDLFRSQLGGHPTPPADDLWARLQAHTAAPDPAAGPIEPAAEQVDQLYQTHLGRHATPPRRELWERLEDEHLRPRKRRAAAWWPMAMAAAVALLLLAGGAGLWLGYPGSQHSNGTLATQASTQPAGSKDLVLAPAGPVAGETQAAEISAATVAAAGTAPDKGTLNPLQKNFTTQATALGLLPSSASKAVRLAVRQSAHPRRNASRQPDAAAASASLLAQARPLLHPAPTTPLTSRPVPADEPAPAVASTTPVMAPNAGAAALPVPALATANSIIAVDVRSGAAPRRPTLASAVAAATARASQQRGLGGRLLHQAGHLLRGERLSLSEVTSLPESLTVEASLAGRRVSKTIQL